MPVHHVYMNVYVLRRDTLANCVVLIISPQSAHFCVARMRRERAHMCVTRSAIGPHSWCYLRKSSPMNKPHRRRP